MADNVSKGQHSMSANNRSQQLMTVLAATDFSAPRSAQHFSLFFPCICAILFCFVFLFFVVFICRKSVLRRVSSHLWRTPQQHMLEEVLIGTKQKGPTLFTVKMASLPELSHWSLKYLFFTLTLFPAKTELVRWLNHNLTAADLDLMYVCVCVCFMVRGNSHFCSERKIPIDYSAFLLFKNNKCRSLISHV